MPLLILRKLPQLSFPLSSIALTYSSETKLGIISPRHLACTPKLNAQPQSPKPFVAYIFLGIYYFVRIRSLQRVFLQEFK